MAAKEQAFQAFHFEPHSKTSSGICQPAPTQHHCIIREQSGGRQPRLHSRHQLRADHARQADRVDGRHSSSAPARSGLGLSLHSHFQHPRADHHVGCGLSFASLGAALTGHGGHSASPRDLTQSSHSSRTAAASGASGEDDTAHDAGQRDGRRHLGVIPSHQPTFNHPNLAQSSGRDYTDSQDWWRPSSGGKKFKHSLLLQPYIFTDFFLNAYVKFPPKLTGSPVL